MKTKIGKLIPVQENEIPHDCHLSPFYHKDKIKARAVGKQAISRIDDYQIREDAEAYIKQTNARLAYANKSVQNLSVSGLEV